MRHSTLIATLAVLVGCATAQAADVYRYVDEQGRTHYSDRPAPGAVLVTSTNPRPNEVAEATERRNNNNTQLAATNQRIAEGQAHSTSVSAVQRDLEATRAERCKKARSDYDKAIQSQRVYNEKPDGTRVYLSEAELAQYRVNAHKQLQAVCGQG